MFTFVRYLLSRIANYWDVISAVLSWLWTIGGGVMSAWATYTAGLFAQYAPLSWVAAGLVGALLAAWAALSISYVRYLLTKMKAYQSWSQRAPGGINPVDREFHKQRIQLADIANQFSRLISDKRFIDCELTGPCNLIFIGGVTATNATFMDCDIVEVKSEQVTRGNKIAIINTEILGGKIYNATLFVPSANIHMFANMSPIIITHPPTTSENKS
jgi:hypothetical protein